MSAVSVPNQTDFLRNTLGLGSNAGPRHLEKTPGPANMRELAVIISSLQTQGARAADAEDSDKIARKTRASILLRYELIRSEVQDGVYNPLQAIRNRGHSNFVAKGAFWDVSNDELTHDIAYRRIRERAGVTDTPSPKQVYRAGSGGSRDPRNVSQYLISQLQEKHTEEAPPAIIISPPESEASEHHGSELELTEPEDLAVEIPSGGAQLLACAQRELAYIVLVLTVSLRHQTRQFKGCTTARCQDYKIALQNSVIPAHLDRLAARDKTARALHEQIDREIAAPCESLKLDADRTIAQINTSLNLKLRDCATMLTDLERCPGTHCFLQMGYAALEWAVLLLLRSIWAVACLVKLLHGLAQWLFK